MNRLRSAEIASALFILEPDRDERASQVCMETLLTLYANDFQVNTEFRSPKHARFATRCLALKENFLKKREEPMNSSLAMSAEEYGRLLSSRSDFAGSENLGAIGLTLQGLVDPETRRGQVGTWLLYPFHASMLWHDARPGPGGRYDIRKVYMRGSGITLARVLCDPPAASATSRAKQAMLDLKIALTADSQIGQIATTLNKPIAERHQDIVQLDEKESWKLGADEKLTHFSAQLTSDVASILGQRHIAETAKLWQFRNILSLNFALHLLNCAWDDLGTAQSERVVLLSVGGAERLGNAVRLRSEDSFKRAKRRIREAIVKTLTAQMKIVASTSDADWEGELENRRGRLNSWIAKLNTMQAGDDFTDIAIGIIEAGGYERPVDGFRVLCESIGLVQGTGGWKHFSVTPQLFEGLVGSLAEEMPMTSKTFFSKLYDRWRIVLSPEAATKTGLLRVLEETELARNARRAERMLIEAGLAQSLSDSTTLVGHRVRK